jgi:hypothetical protein
MNIMVGYLTEHGRPKFFVFHWYVEKFVGASLQLCKARIASDLLTCPFKFFYIPIRTHSKDIYNQLFDNYIHFVLMPKVDICTFDKKNV